MKAATSVPSLVNSQKGIPKRYFLRGKEWDTPLTQTMCVSKLPSKETPDLLYKGAFLSIGQSYDQSYCNYPYMYNHNLKAYLE